MKVNLNNEIKAGLIITVFEEDSVNIGYGYLTYLY